MPKTQKIRIIWGILILAAVSWFFITRPSQDKSKNTIRVLIDRMPNRQSLDIRYRRIAPLMDEFHYTYIEDLSREKVTLTPPNPSDPEIEFKVVRDETTQALLFYKGDADVLYDSLSLSKTEWVKKNAPQVRVESASGLSFSYLGFNFRNPILTNPKVRKAITLALPLESWIQEKYFNWVEAMPGAPSYQPQEAAKLLDQEGYPADKNNFRFELRYFTTPVREGHELGALISEALKKIGITVKISSIETSLFFDKIRQGHFDLFSSRWFRFSTEASTFDLLSKNGRHNFFGYTSEKIERQKPETLTFSRTQTLLKEDLPFVPLFTWKHGLILNPRIEAPPHLADQFDETLRFLRLLRIK